MFYLAGIKLTILFNEYVKEFNIVPVAISYEFDPGDADKAHELYEKSKNGEYQKSEFEDIDSIVKGISGYKGRIHIKVGNVIKENFETPEELAGYIDRYIHQNYHLFPSNLIAARSIGEGREAIINPEDEEKFNSRINLVPIEEREFVKKYYAKPVSNAMKYN